MEKELNPERGEMAPEQLRKKPFDCMVTHEEMKRMPGVEDKERRTRGSKIYSLGRGLYQAVLYPEAVHAQAKDGSWVEIDNRLEEKRDDRGLFITNRQNPDLKVVFRPTPENEMVHLENRKGQCIAWCLENAQPVQPVVLPFSGPEHNENDQRREVLDHLDAEVKYESILPGIDLRCRVKSSSFKDEWVIADRKSACTLHLNLFTPGMIPQLQKDREIQLVGAGGEIPFILPAPFLKDAEENSVGDVSVSLMPLENEKDMWRVVYTPSEEWLNSAQFPVTLDPAVVTVQNNASLIEDNYVTSKQPSTVQQVNLEVLRVTKGSGTWGTSNSFIKFNNGSLPTIDSSYYVTKAEFSIQTAQSGLYGLSRDNNPTAASTVYLREVLGPWSSYTITYNNRPAVNNLILDYEYIPKNSELTWLNFDISNLVRKWYSNEGSNYGISLEAADNTWINFYSSDYAYAKPYVTVNYVSLAGLESSLAYEEQNVGRAGTGYVSLYNGNLIFEHPDTVCNGNLMPVSTTHYYNSCYHNQDVFGLGHGWKLNLQQCLHKETLLSNNSTVTYYVYTDGDGTRHHFKQSSGKWKDLSGLGMELTISGSSATITDKSNTAMLFDLPTVEFNGNYANVKMLQSITDSCGNVMTIHTGSNRQFIYATDGAGRYTESLRSVWMEELWGPEGAGTGVSFEYNNNGNLTKIYYQDGGSTTYTYNANGLLESVTNLDGYKVTYTYNGNGEPYRVNQVVFSNGNVLYSGRRYDYRDCLTVVTDLIPNAAGNALTEGRLLFYHFNDYGNVVSVNDQLGYACFAKYSDELPVNHPEVASKMQRSVVNLLKGHNMESTGSWTNMNISGTGTYSYATDAAYMGSKSLKMAKTNSTGLMTSYQIATLERGKTYTFSAYFKTLSSASAQLRAVYKDNVGIDVAKDSQKQKNNAAWDRISLTFTLPANSTSNSVTVYLMAADGAGSVWFDCAQLEGGAAANRYNMLLNGDFTFNTGAHPTAWLANSSNVSTTDIVTSTFSGTKPEGLSHNTMYLYGAGRSKYPGIYQDIPMSGNQGDVYTAGGWSFNYSKPRKGENFRYNIRVAFLKTGTSSTRENAPSIEWSEEWTDWQFAAGPVVAPCNYTSIRFNVDYERNVNHAEFGGLFLHKEEFGKTFAYDENGNVLSTKNLASMQSHATYDSEDNLLTYRQPGRPSTVKYTLDWGDTTAEKKKHLLKSTTSPLGIMTAATYDDKGNPLTSQTKNSSGSMVIESQTTYTANQNYVATQKDARGKVITNNTDLTKGTLTSVTDPKGQTVNYEYDDFKRTTGVYTTADGKTYRNAYTYTQDKLTKVAHNTTDNDVCDVEYNFAFDGAGRPTTVQVGSQTLSTTVYNPDGTVQKVTYGNSSAGSPQEVRYAYDDFKRLKGVQFDGETSDAYTYEYGANGQVMRLTDTILDRRMMSEYDTANRPMRITHMEGEDTHLYTGQVEYDEYNNLKTFKEQVGTARTPYQTDFTYDNENKPTLMTFGDTSNKVAYAYDAIGRMSSRTVTAAGHSYATTFNYLAGSNGSGNTTPLVASMTQSGETCSYTYDDVGNILTATRNGVTTSYVYDNLGQLTRVNDPSDTTSGSAGTTWVYDYDRGGNILAKKRYAYTTGTLGTALETVTYTYDTTWKDKLIQYSVQVGTDPATTYSVTSDAIGNPTNDGTWHYTWARGRQLQVMYKGSFGQPGYDEIAFTYNPEGLRTRKTRMYYSNGDVAYSSTEYTLHGKNIVHMTQGNDSLHFFYDASNRPAIVEWNNGVTAAKYAYIQNLQGDIVGIVDSNGTEVVKYTYDAWGKVLSTTGSLASTLGNIQPFRYRGYVYDVETGLYYLRSRYYNPTWGRFLNADGLIGKRLFGANVYCYCACNPVNRTDNSGRDWFNDVKEWFEQAWSDVSNAVSDVWNAVSDRTVELWTNISSGVSQGWYDASSWCSQAWKDVSSRVSQAWNDALSWITQAWNDVSSGVSQAWCDVSSWVSQTWNDTLAWVSNNWISVIDWGANISSVAGTAYGIIQTLVPRFGLPAIPVIGQVVFLATEIWSIARLAGFGEE